MVNVQLNVGQEAVAAIAPKQSLSASKPQPADLLCPLGLGTAIEAITNRSLFSRGRWGILIQTLSSSNTLYSHDARKYFVPASNVKLLTTAAALHQLGAKFRIRTSIYSTSDASLRIIGRGDPSLTDTQLRKLAHQLKRRGIRRVRQLIGEDKYFRGLSINPTWEWEDVQADYGAPVNSLILNQNVVELKLSPQQLGQPLKVVWTDPLEATQWWIQNESVTVPQIQSTSVSVSRDSAEPLLRITGQLGVDSQPETVALAVLNPTEHFLRHFRRALTQEGIDITADIREYMQSPNFIRVNQRLSTVRELAYLESPPLSQLLVETNQNSNNLYAEALLRTLGVKTRDTDSTKSTLEMGLSVVKSTLTSLGVDPTSYVLADGSGLSRHNLMSPEALVQTLKAMAQSSEADVYRASLPVAGISGTLQNRFRNSGGIIQAKTGTLSGVVALSGYLDAPDYEPLVFSIIVNQSSQSDATVLRQAVDKIVLLLTRLRRC